MALAVNRNNTGNDIFRNQPTNTPKKVDIRDWTGDGAIYPSVKNVLNFGESAASHHTGYFSSREVLMLAKEIFGGFADYDGASIEVNRQNEVFLKLRFNHLRKNINDPDALLAFKSGSDNIVRSDGSSSSNLREIIATAQMLAGATGRTSKNPMDGVRTNGTSYQITNEAKCIIHKFIGDRFHKDWSEACSDININGITYTDINGIDIVKIFEQKYGKNVDPTDELSSKVKYLVEPIAVADTMQGKLYKLQVTQIVADAVDDQLRMFGYQYGNEFM